MSSLSTRSAGLARVFWRLHFWAGLLTAPIVLFAALTGLAYVFTPQIEGYLYAHLDRSVSPLPHRPLDEQVAAARQRFPDRAVRFVVPPHGPHGTTQVHVAAPPAHHGAAPSHDHGLPGGSIVYVAPSTAQVLGHLHEMQRFKTWAAKLHSSALQGDGWRWLMELAASWMLVMLATGWYLWWPRAEGRRGWRALLPRLHGGRPTWRDVHAIGGVLMSGVLLVVLVTGLTWSRHAGQNFRALQQVLGQETPRAPKELLSTPGTGLLSLQAAYEKARAYAPDVQVQLTPPSGPRGAWRIENFDRSQPDKRFTLALDARTGAVLHRAGWRDFKLLPRATAVGIPFHRGEFGLWNQALLVLAAVMCVFSVVSGIAMWWLRRPRGHAGVPHAAAAHLRAVPAWLWAGVALLAWALPVFGLSLALFAGAEAALAVARRATPHHAG